MTPGELLAWVGAIALSAVIVVLAVALIVALVKGIRTPPKRKVTLPTGNTSPAGTPKPPLTSIKGGRE